MKKEISKNNISFHRTNYSTGSVIRPHEYLLKHIESGPYSLILDENSDVTQNYNQLNANDLKAQEKEIRDGKLCVHVFYVSHCDIN